jgi:hypothetical protein
MMLIPENSSLVHLYFTLIDEFVVLQILNVYYPKYEMGGKLWPIMHNTIVFSLVLTQVIALGVFTIKHSPVAAGFTILLLVGTVLFNEYCRHRFSRIFEAYSAQVSGSVHTMNNVCLLAVSQRK